MTSLLKISCAGLLVAGSLAVGSTAASAGPIMPLAAVATAADADAATNVDKVAWVCGPYRCWWRPGPYWGPRPYYWHRPYWGPRPWGWGWHRPWY